MASYDILRKHEPEMTTKRLNELLAAFKTLYVNKDYPQVAIDIRGEWVSSAAGRDGVFGYGTVRVIDQLTETISVKFEGQLFVLPLVEDNGGGWQGITFINVHSDWN